MAKPRKNYISRKKPVWQIVLFYVIVSCIVIGMLHYSGLIDLGSTEKQETDFSSSDYNYIE